MCGETVAECGGRQFVRLTVHAVGGSTIAVQDVSVWQTACHGVPVACCPDRRYGRTILEGDVLVGISYETSDIVLAFQYAETGTVDDVAIGRITHDTAYAGCTLHGVFSIEDEIGNDGMRLERSLSYAHEA